MAISPEAYSPYIAEAEKFTTDMEDAPVIALALSIKDVIRLYPLMSR